MEKKGEEEARRPRGCNKAKTSEPSSRLPERSYQATLSSIVNDKRYIHYLVDRASVARFGESLGSRTVGAALHYGFHGPRVFRDIAFPL